MRIGLSEDDVARILRAIIDVRRKDGWSHSFDIERRLRGGIWQKKSTSFPTMIFGQFCEDGHLEKQVRGDSTFYRVTDSAVNEFAMDVPSDDGDDESVDAASAGITASTPSDEHDSDERDSGEEKIQEVIIAVRECAGEDGWAQDTSIFTELRRSTNRWASIQWAYFSTEMNKLIKDGWLERGDGPKRNHHRLTAKSQQPQPEASPSPSAMPTEVPPPVSAAEDAGPVEPPFVGPPEDPPPQPPTLPPPLTETVSAEEKGDTGSARTEEAREKGREETAGERRKAMKPTERARKLPFPERVRLAWRNTPGETTTEKQEHIFTRHATDMLQKIFGLNLAASAQQFMDKLRNEGLFTGDDGSYYWANDMSNYGLAEGESDDGQEDDDSSGGNPNESGEDVVVGDESAGQSASTRPLSEAFASLTAKKPWVSVVIAAADMLSGLSPEQYFAVRAVFAGLKVPPSYRKQALRMLDAIMLAPLEESEED